MLDYFRSWKRKAGVVTLGFALMFISCWTRSKVYSDQIHVRSKTALHILTSTSGTFKWERVTGISFAANVSPFRWNTSPTIAKLYDDSLQNVRLEWRWRFCGFDFGVGNEDIAAFAGVPRVRIAVWTIPYWSIVIPLTLLSAWLLLSKPRPTVTKPGSPV